MTLDIYSTGAIRGVVAKTKVPSLFLLKTFFGTVIDAVAGQEEIDFDVITDRRRITPFVSPLVAGKLVSQNGYFTSRFKPAYAKDKRALDPRRAFKRMAGEQLQGLATMSPLQREAAILGVEIGDMVDMYHRRLELMAADVLDDGIATISGDGFPTVNVDFQRQAASTITLTGGNRWGQANISPVANVNTWRLTFLQASGLKCTDIVFSADAWELFRVDPAFLALVSTFNRGTETSAELIVDYGEGAEYQGRLGAGGPRLWVYVGWYEDPNNPGTENPIMPANTVWLGSSDPRAQGFQGFGAVVDADAGYPSGAGDNLFIKSWTEKDPGQRMLLGQGAPLVGLSRPNATLRARVA